MSVLPFVPGPRAPWHWRTLGAIAQLLRAEGTPPDDAMPFALRDRSATLRVSADGHTYQISIVEIGAPRS